MILQNRYQPLAPSISAAFLRCESCGYLIPEYMKTELFAVGKWRPTAEASEPFHRSYLLPSWYSPPGFFSWAEGVRIFLNAKKKGDAEALKTWTNQINAETWKERQVTIDETVLFSRREKYPAEVPAGALVLTAGVDVQEDRFEVTVWGWGPGFEAWAIENRVFWAHDGASPRDYPGELWDRLDEFLLKSWKHESGTRLFCAAVGIDTGGSFTQQTYQFVKDREARAIYAMKGRGGAGIPDVSAPAKRRSGESDIPVELFTIGTDAMKDKLFARLSMRSPGPGYLHFPDSEDFDLEFFAALTGEKKIIRQRKGFRVADWVRFRRNDVLDCYVYANAAAMILSPVWESLKEALDRERDSGPPAPPAPRSPQVRRRSWVSRWKR